MTPTATSQARAALAAALRITRHTDEPCEHKPSCQNDAAFLLTALRADPESAHAVAAALDPDGWVHSTETMARQTSVVIALRAENERLRKHFAALVADGGETSHREHGWHGWGPNARAALDASPAPRPTPKEPTDG